MDVKFKWFLIYGAAVIGMLTLFTFCCGCGVVDWAIKLGNKSYVDDNALEERAEDMIQSVTGLQVDLSPSTPEE